MGRHLVNRTDTRSTARRRTTRGRTSWLRAAVPALVAVSALVCGTVAAAPAAGVPDDGRVDAARIAKVNAALPTPLSDSFYKTPKNIAAYKQGQIISTRSRPNPPAFVDVKTYQIKFRSNDSENKPIAAITTVLVPNRKKANGPLLSFQHIVNAVGLECAPSQVLWTQDPNLTIREAPALNVVLQQGWTVSIPDHLGPRSAYGAAKLGGQISLDAITATQNFTPAAVKHSKVGLAGYSGGGMATAWAAALAPKYTPDLNIVGAAYGGVPMDLIKMAEGLGYNRPHPAFGLAFAAAIGLAREYSDKVTIFDFLSTDGKRMFSEMRNACTNDVLRIGAGHSARQVTKSGVQLFENKTFRKIGAENSLAMYPGVPTAPIFEWHSPTDVLIPLDSISSTIRRYCKAGTKVQTLLTPSPEHMSAAVIGVLPAMDFLSARFRGEPVPSTC
ncbi:lipase [Gordonia pseudamarae]|jgi:pimeloyl-ACP methyl ester carboxylesterase|uniref:Lipase n=1 Tax=Gordonia pseudamarae TaxID=2831662 RepID=A0ABX6IIM6_9ACTN|nr:lipase [Gordonia pseudamarae]QHN34991.1 lipase [Gordonia pseudamarae]